MFAFKPSLTVNKEMAKYIQDCTNKSIERKINLKKQLLESKDYNNNNNNNIELISNSGFKNTLIVCSFFSFISFLAGYHFKGIKA
jgi:hypothetical protein